MKKILVAVAVAALGITASAQTNQVLSRNAVGYQRIDLPGGGLEFVANQFNQLDASASALSNAVPNASNNTQAILWDVNAQQYVTLTRTKNSWQAGGSNSLARGRGFFLRGPAGISQTVFIMGEVPDKLTATQTVAYAIPGINALGSSYPVSQPWTNTLLSQGLANNDQFIVWDSSITNYIAYTKTKGNWGAGTNYLLKSGQAFFIRKNSAGTNTWTEAKPYTWP